MSAMSKVPALELNRVRALRTVWQDAWVNRLDTPIPALLTGLEASLDRAMAAAEVEGSAEKGYSAINIAVEIPTNPAELERPLELVQALYWNSDIIERTIETLVAECRRRQYSWADIAAALNVARQSAWTKYASLEAETTA